jgi:hypothetical protein
VLFTAEESVLLAFLRDDLEGNLPFCCLFSGTEGPGLLTLPAAADPCPDTSFLPPLPRFSWSSGGLVGDDRVLANPMCWCAFRHPPAVPAPTPDKQVREVMFLESQPVFGGARNCNGKGALSAKLSSGSARAPFWPWLTPGCARSWPSKPLG